MSRNRPPPLTNQRTHQRTSRINKSDFANRYAQGRAVAAGGQRTTLANVSAQGTASNQPKPTIKGS